MISHGASEAAESGLFCQSVRHSFSCYFLRILQFFMDSLAHRLTARAFDWILIFGPKIVIALLLFFTGRWLIRMLNRWFRKVISHDRFDVTLRPFLRNLFSIVL